MRDVKSFAFGGMQSQAPLMLGGLDDLTDKLVRRLRPLLEPIIGAKPNLNACQPRVMDFAEWNAEIAEFSSISTYRLPPLRGQCMLRLDAGLIALLVDCFYGGRGVKSQPKRREFTPTEERLIARLTTGITQQFCACFQEILPIEAVLVGREAGPVRTSALTRQEQIFLVRAELTIGDRAWPIDMAVPMSVLRAVEHRLESKADEGDERSNPVWQERLNKRVEHVMLPARTILARPSMTLQDVMKLEAGDVIPVNIDRSLPLIVGSRVIAHGTIGEQNGRAAFMIEKLAQEKDR